MDAVTMRRDNRRLRLAERKESDRVLARADSMTVLVDRQLERLQIAAEQYRQRRENEGEPRG